MKKFVLALFATMGLVGIVVGDEFNADVKKVDGGKITAAKVAKGAGAKAGAKAAKKGAKKADPPPPAEDVVYDVAKGAVIAEGAFDADTKSFKAGTAIAKGLMDEAFTSASADKALRVRITTADEDKGDVKKGQITQILVTKGGGGKKKGG